MFHPLNMIKVTLNWTAGLSAVYLYESTIINILTMKQELNYNELYKQLIDTFSGKQSKEWLNSKGVDLWFNSFHSSNSAAEGLFSNDVDDDLFFNPKTAKKCNENFEYPIFVPDSPNARNNCIILLHGLNERNWDKYLPWAYSLARQTGKSVILFPIAYHMSRSPEYWKDPRKMLPYVLKRHQELPDVGMSSVANVALSKRLTLQPERLFFSGHQVAGDIINLMDSITAGEHPMFNKDTKIDYFSYSIGTFLTQVLMLGNPGKRFDDSKFFFFCGGSAFDDIHGVSKFILDTKAYERLKDYYSNRFESDIKKNTKWQNIFNSQGLGDSFKSMLSVKLLKHYNKKLFSKYKNRLMALTLKKDKVIIPDKVKCVLGNRVEETDYNYLYTHENPFPVSNKPLVKSQVNEAFGNFINKAASFLI